MYNNIYFRGLSYKVLSTSACDLLAMMMAMVDGILWSNILNHVRLLHNWIGGCVWVVGRRVEGRSRGNHLRIISWGRRIEA